ncbi:Endonuclease/exonuclease/phosphatase [Lenzites betulinus]|nr:Endonuclease/exonuclease/phosphatase [Lenzites betulinus]
MDIGTAATTSGGRGGVPAVSPSGERGGVQDSGRRENGGAAAGGQPPLLFPRVPPLAPPTRGQQDPEWDPEAVPPPAQAEGGPRLQEQQDQHRIARKQTIRIGSLNMNGYGSLRPENPDNKWKTMYQTMKKHGLGILMLQETHLTDQRKDDVKRMFKGRIKILHSAHPDAPTRKEGVAIVLNKSQINANGAAPTVVVPGRALQVAICAHGTEPSLHVLCIYAPTSDGIDERREFFTKVREFYERHPAVQKPHLIAGDFNNTEDMIDRLPIAEPDASLGELDELKLALGLMTADGWRMTHPTTRSYTFHRGTGNDATCSRLDRIYVTPGIFSQAREWDITAPGVRTDHNLVTVQIAMADAPRVGPGRPVFPMHLLKDKKITKTMKNTGIAAESQLDLLLNEGVRTDLHNPQTILYNLKVEWMRAARTREKEIVPKLLAEIRQLEQEKARLSRLQASTDTEQLQAANVVMLNKQITELKIRQIHLRQQNGRARHRLDGERPTKYWMTLNKPPAPHRGGRPRTYESDATKMVEMARMHHDNLQWDEDGLPFPERRDACIEEALASIDRKLDGTQIANLSALITYDECELALRFSKSATAAGLDGLQYEVWKTLHARYIEDNRHEGRPAFDVLKILTSAFRDVQLHGVAPGIPFSDGWMAPIYKEKGERTKVVNYRPITLLNTDYKLLSKVLSIRGERSKWYNCRT